jgi:hypothetical protein
MKDIIRKASRDCFTMKLPEFIDKYPAQVLLSHNPNVGPTESHNCPKKGNFVCALIVLDTILAVSQ